jgi:hypothetical protein
VLELVACQDYYHGMRNAVILMSFFNREKTLIIILLNDFICYVFFLVMIIFWLTNLLTLSVPDAEYSRNTSHAFNLISKYLFLINQKSCVVVLSLHFLYNLMKFVFKMLAFWTQNIHYSVIVLLYLTVSDPVK